MFAHVGERVSPVLHGCVLATVEYHRAFEDKGRRVAVGPLAMSVTEPQTLRKSGRAQRVMRSSVRRESV